MKQFAQYLSEQSIDDKYVIKDKADYDRVKADLLVRPYNIEAILDPSEELQLIALSRNIWSCTNLDNPCERILNVYYDKYKEGNVHFWLSKNRSKKLRKYFLRRLHREGKLHKMIEDEIINNLYRQAGYKIFFEDPELQNDLIEEDPTTIQYFSKTSKFLQEKAINLGGKQIVPLIKNIDKDLAEKYQSILAMKRMGIFK